MLFIKLQVYWTMLKERIWYVITKLTIYWLLTAFYYKDTRKNLSEIVSSPPQITKHNEVTQCKYQQVLFWLSCGECTILRSINSRLFVYISIMSHSKVNTREFHWKSVNSIIDGVATTHNDAAIALILRKTWWKWINRKRLRLYYYVTWSVLFTINKSRISVCKQRWN